MRAFWKSPLFVALAIAIVSVLSGDIRNVEHFYWNPLFKVISEPAPDSSAIVSLDAGAVEGTPPPISSTAQQAKLVTWLTAEGARHIYLDFPTAAGADPQGDAALRDAIIAAGKRITLINRGSVSYDDKKSLLQKPKFAAPAGTDVAASSWDINFLGYALASDARVSIDGKSYPVVPLVASNMLSTEGRILPDYRVDPKSIRSFNAAAILAGGVTPDLVRGRDLYVTGTSDTLPTSTGYFGHGYVPSAAIDISASQGLARRTNVEVPWHPFLLLFVAIALIGRTLPRRRTKILFYSAGMAALFFFPVILLDRGIVTHAGDGLIAAFVYGAMRIWQKWRLRVATTSSASGLPNIEALAAEGIAAGSDVVAVSVSQYEQMLASLPRELHGECARQIARRLSVAASGSKIYDNDNGHFVWLVQPYTLDALVAQFEGLKALFSAPLLIEGHVLDTNVHFGLDRNADSRPINRIRSAIVSSSEAQSKGKLYEEFGQQRLAQTPWELSLNARIDEALRNGAIWLAFQGQYDLQKDRIGGAETLIRWTDPERGMIPPDSFIIQAERAGRIDAITYWVLERAIEASRDLQRRVGNFDLSVNLSAWMVDQPGLTSHIAEIVRKHDADCSRLTFEVTETFSLTNREVAKRNLGELRGLGFRLSIDDFGTGQASLAYLSEIPSDEIKLDKRFIQAIVGSKRDRTIVSSTIQLAHALNQVIVAEGVEDLATLRVLKELGCDIAQGYLIGRPVAYADFLRTISESVPRRFGVV
jgi:EAL domain-containing protein (putative c-di-GMP-specific phosphodiesterase class I)